MKVCNVGVSGLFCISALASVGCSGAAAHPRPLSPVDRNVRDGTAENVRPDATGDCRFNPNGAVGGPEDCVPDEKASGCRFNPNGAVGGPEDCVPDEKSDCDFDPNAPAGKCRSATPRAHTTSE